MRRFTLGLVSGQSMVVLALMLVVLIGLVGLSVDVGNAYGQQRRIQSAVNGAALAGALKSGEFGTSGDVREAIIKDLQGHGLDTTTGSAYTWTAYYVTPNGSGESRSQIPATGYPPGNLKRIEVEATQRLDTYFAKVLGRNDLTVKGDGYACGGRFPEGVYPLALPYYLYPGNSVEYRHWTSYPNSNITNTGQDATSASDASNGSEIAAASQTQTRQTWSLVANGASDASTGKIFKILTGNNTGGIPGQHIGWIALSSVDSGGGSASTLGEDLAYPGNYTDGPRTTDCSGQGCYQEAPIPLNADINANDGVRVLPNGTNTIYSPPDLIKPSQQVDKRISPYDWITGNTGVSLGSGVDGALDNHILRGDEMILPMYGAGVGEGSNGKFQILDLGKFRFLKREYNGNNSWMVFEYLGRARVKPITSCLPPT